MAANPTLNERACRLADHMANTAEALNIDSRRTRGGARLIDCGVDHFGGLQAGLGLARVCLAGQAEVSLVPGDVAGLPCPLVQVVTDQPLRACLTSQYAGWQIKVGKFFALGSGPMRAHYGKEALYDEITGVYREVAPVAVGAVEASQMPGEDVIAYLSDALKLPPDKITLLVAPAASMAGNLQVVARALETALHKLHELHFDLDQVVSGYGVAPLPPVADDEVRAIGRTNDAILYGGRVVLWVVVEEDDELVEVGAKVPSSASPDHGAPFAEVFARYEHDFYKIDPMLFSPAQVVFHNLCSGKTHAFGRLEPETLRRSFYGG